MLISILTLFPEVLRDTFSFSIIGRAQKKGLVKIRIINIRDYASDKHRSVDDKPYGGGVGMIMRVDIVEKAIEATRIKQHSFAKKKIREKVILLDPAGEELTQTKVRSFSRLDHLILVCGHYEGLDARISRFVNETISIGKYILTGGEIPAMVVTDAVIRLVPNVLAKKTAVLNESFSQANLLEAPQFTRPAIYKDYKVPSVLLSGNHQKIEGWKRKQAVLRTKKRCLLK